MYKHIKDLNQKWYQNLISKWARRNTEGERERKPFMDDTQFFNIDFWIHIIEMINKQRENIKRERERKRLRDWKRREDARQRVKESVSQPYASSLSIGSYIIFVVTVRVSVRICAYMCVCACVWVSSSSVDFHGHKQQTATIAY